MWAPGVDTLGLVACILAAEAGPSPARFEPVPAIDRSWVDAQFPDAPADDAAQRLAALVAAIGIQLDSAWTPALPSGDEPPTQDEAGRRALTRWFREESRRAEDRIQPQPPAVAAYLDSRRPEILAIESALLHGDPPRWQVATAATRPMPGPGFFSVVSLAQILLGEGLERQRHGDPHGALDALEATWRLGESVASRPDLSDVIASQYLYLAQARVLRKLADIPPFWRERLDPATARARLRTNYGIELLRLSEWAEVQQPPFFDQPEIGPEPGSLGERVAMWAYTSPPARALVRGCVENGERRLRQVVAALEALDPCGIADEATDEWLESSRPWLCPGNGVPFINSPGSLWRRLGQLAMELELTRLTAELKDIRARDGAWPASFPAAARSSCAGARWVYERTPDGGARLELEPTPDWRSYRETEPLRFVALPPAGEAPAAAPAQPAAGPARPANAASR